MNSPQFSQLNNDIEDLVNCYVKYIKYLKEQLQAQKEQQNLNHSVQMIGESRPAYPQTWHGVQMKLIWGRISGFWGKIFQFLG